MFIKSLLMLVLGACGIYFNGAILFRVWRAEPLPFGVWWLPKDLDDRATIERFIIGGIAIFATLVTGSIFVFGFLGVLKIAFEP